MYKRIGRKEFLEIARKTTFSTFDEIEAKNLGYKNCFDSLKKSKKWMSKYFVFESTSGSILALGVLERDGNFAFYVTNENYKNILPLYRQIKDFINSVVSSCGGIVTEVSPLHKEAIRMLKMLGFKVVSKSDKSFKYAIEEPNG